MSKTPGWTLGRTIPSSIGPGFPSGQAVGINADDSSGSGNYNALYTTFTMRDFHGVTTTSNFTWGRALGTGSESQATSGYTALNPYNVRQSMYGPQFYDYKFLYTQIVLVVGAVLQGQQGHPRLCARRMALRCDLHGAQRRSAGRRQPSAATVRRVFRRRPKLRHRERGQPLRLRRRGSRHQIHRQQLGHLQHQCAQQRIRRRHQRQRCPTAETTSTCSRIPATIYNEFRPCILGYDTSCGGNGQIRGLPNWNMDANIAKDFRLFRERVSGTLSFQFINVFNHVILNDPYLDLSDAADFGVLGSNNPTSAAKRTRRAASPSTCGCGSKPPAVVSNNPGRSRDKPRGALFLWSQAAWDGNPPQTQWYHMRYHRKGV